MKLTTWVVAVLIGASIGLSGCKKEKPAGEFHVLDATQLRPAFASAGPETQAIVNDVMFSIQGSYFDKALASLDKLANTPGITDEQKKVVSAVIEQVKQKMTGTGPPAQ